MNISPINNTNKTQNFKAIKIANIKTGINNNISSIDLYQLRREDYGFIQKLAKKINFENTENKISEYYKNRWQKVFKYCIETAFDHFNITYIAISQNKPCGIMTFSNKHSIFLDGICAIPNEQGEKVPFTGKSLLFELFKVANETSAKSINLNAVPDGTFNPVRKYEELGFKRNATQENEYIAMECNKYKIQEQLKTLSKDIEYSPYNCEKTQLDQFID